MLLNKYKSINRIKLLEEMNEKNCYYGKCSNSSIGEAEADVYLYLKENLSDEYIVYHNFHYISENNIPHQIDFLIFNKKYGYIVLEVKSYDKMKEKDRNGIEQEEQADCQRKDLISIVDKVCNLRGKRQYIDFMVLYWNVKRLNNIESEIYENKKIKWNNKSFLYCDIKSKKLDKFFEDFFKSHMWNKTENGYNYLKETKDYSYSKAENCFKKLCSDLHNNIDEIDYAELDIEEKLTKIQRYSFNLITSQNNNIVFVDGDAGTGKTYLAMAIIEKCKKENKKVFYVLFTNKLINFINNKFKKYIGNIKFIKFYSKNDDEINLNKIGFNDRNLVIIIDEAQDIRTSFLVKVINKCKKCGIKLIILNSDKQASLNFDYNSNDVRIKVENAGGVKFQLFDNCRNIQDIVEILNSIFTCDNYKDLIEINYVKDIVEAECKIFEYINKLVVDGLDAEKISILTNCKNSDFFNGKVILFRKIKNEFPKIDIDTINRNKGCENTVIIIYDNVGTLIDKKIDLYIALSRAKIKYKYYCIK